MIRVLDFESTGLPPDADVVEAACVDVLDGNCLDGPGWSQLVCTTRPVSVEARAAHHLSNAEIAGGIPWETVKQLLTFPGYYCAHNADFEKFFFNPDGSRWIEAGHLKAERRGTNRVEIQGGDMWWIQEKDIRQFIVENIALIDIRKVDKFWFVDLLART